MFGFERVIKLALARVSFSEKFFFKYEFESGFWVDAYPGMLEFWGLLKWDVSERCELSVEELTGLPECKESDEICALAVSARSFLNRRGLRGFLLAVSEFSGELEIWFAAKVSACFWLTLFFGTLNFFSSELLGFLLACFEFKDKSVSSVLTCFAFI